MEPNTRTPNSRAPNTRTLGRLTQSLGIYFALAAGIGLIIGAGILRVPGAVAGLVSEYWVIMALWTWGGIHALLGANVFAELATALPRAGGSYVPVRAAFGDFAGLVIGWADWLAHAAGGAALALAVANFLAMILPGTAAYAAQTASALILIDMGINQLGVEAGSLTQKIISGLKIVFLATVIGAIFFSPVPPSAAAEPAAAPAPAGLWAILGAYQLIVGVYSGWKAPIYFAGESQNPSRDIPRALILSIGTVTLVYVLMNAALLKALPHSVLAGSQLPAALALDAVLGPQAGFVIACLAVVVAGSAMNAAIMSTPRILYGLGRDGLFPAAATRVNSGGTPDIALAISGLFMIALVQSGSFESVFMMIGALMVFANALCDASLFVLRMRRPELLRPVRALGYPVLPLAALVLDTGLVLLFLASNLTGGVYMIALVALCVPIYWQLKRAGRLAVPTPVE